MKRKQIIFGVSVLVILAGLFVWNFNRGNSRNLNNRSNARPSSQNTATTSIQKDKDLTGDNDVLVVYFSRTEGVYNGPLEVGNTARVANFIQDATDADTYEIIPAVDYPEEYQATADQAQEEQRRDERPEIANPLPDLSGYETIFIGAPVWWSEYPMIVRTFLDAEGDVLADKTLVPFTTHEGSGLGNTQRQLETQFPNATVLNGFSVRGNSAVNSQADVNDWLADIGVTK